MLSDIERARVHKQCHGRRGVFEIDYPAAFPPLFRRDSGCVKVLYDEHQGSLVARPFWRKMAEPAAEGKKRPPYCICPRVDAWTGHMTSGPWVSWTDFSLRQRQQEINQRSFCR